MDRKEILLRAAWDLLKRSTDDHFVREATSIVTRYDDANCDGYCLMEDIANELELDDDAEPIPPGPDRWKNRSRTYQGIADAMAEAWG